MSPDVAAAVRARLLNEARRSGEEFERKLSRYAAERWLYRLGASAARDRCLLKGASLLAVWLPDPYRATRDPDVLATGATDDAAIRSLVTEVCAVPCPEDGLRFDLSARRDQCEMVAHRQGSGQARHGGGARGRVGVLDQPGAERDAQAKVKLLPESAADYAPTRFGRVGVGREVGGRGRAVAGDVGGVSPVLAAERLASPRLVWPWDGIRRLAHSRGPRARAGTTMSASLGHPGSRTCETVRSRRRCGVETAVRCRNGARPRLPRIPPATIHASRPWSIWSTTAVARAHVSCQHEATRAGRRGGHGFSGVARGGVFCGWIRWIGTLRGSEEAQFGTPAIAGKSRGGTMADERELLRRLSDTVDQVIGFYEGIGGAEVLVNSSWTARDVLAHIVFWHESFARNAGALARGEIPAPLKGTYAQLAERASAEAAGQSVQELLERLAQAHRTIEGLSLDPRVVSIPNKAGSRPYAPAEHLSVVDEHVNGHLCKVRLAYSPAGSRST